MFNEYSSQSFGILYKNRKILKIQLPNSTKLGTMNKDN